MYIRVCVIYLTFVCIIHTWKHITDIYGFVYRCVCDNSQRKWVIRLRGSEVEYIGRIKVREHGRDWREEKEGGEIKLYSN